MHGASGSKRVGALISAFNKEDIHNIAQTKGKEMNTQEAVAVTAAGTAHTLQVQALLDRQQILLNLQQEREKTQRQQDEEMRRLQLQLQYDMADWVRSQQPAAEHGAPQASTPTEGVQCQRSLKFDSSSHDQPAAVAIGVSRCDPTAIYAAAQDANNADQVAATVGADATAMQNN
jgi:hypothetical protein